MRSDTNDDCYASGLRLGRVRKCEWFESRDGCRRLLILAAERYEGSQCVERVKDVGFARRIFTVKGDRLEVSTTIRSAEQVPLELDRGASTQAHRGLLAKRLEVLCGYFDEHDLGSLTGISRS